MRFLYLLLGASCALVGCLALLTHHVWTALLEFALAAMALGAFFQLSRPKADEDA